jgi:hypothetical protein
LRTFVFPAFDRGFEFEVEGLSPALLFIFGLEAFPLPLADPLLLLLFPPLLPLLAMMTITISDDSNTR